MWASRKSASPGPVKPLRSASGAVGSVVGQIGKIKGCRAGGIAGGADKCRFVVEELDHHGPVPRTRPIQLPFGRGFAAPAFAEFRYVRLAFVSSWAERLPLRINSSSWARSSTLNRTTYFLTAISFPTTNHLHRCLAATEIQNLPSFSMTGAAANAHQKRLWHSDKSN
jgi:hypothetical protein